MRCVSVLVREYPADLPALEHAACVAKATNARLLVIIVPLLSLWRTGYLFTTQGPTLGLMPTPSETLLDEAIDSLVAETLRQVSQDLPVTLRAIPRAHPSAVANIVAGAGSQLFFHPRATAHRLELASRACSPLPQGAAYARVSRALVTVGAVDRERLIRCCGRDVSDAKL